MFTSLEKNKLIEITNKQILITLIAVSFVKIGNFLPIEGIDQTAIKKILSDNQNPIWQFIGLYASGGNTIVSPFSLGIIPFINASIVIDLATTFVPELEKLQSEGGELGRQKLQSYKKILSFFISIIQVIFLLNYLKPYIYDVAIQNLFLIGIQFVTGSLIIYWITTIIDSKGLGNGTSALIFTNIIGSIYIKLKNFYLSFELSNFIEFFLFFFFIYLIIKLNSAKNTIKIISARQLSLKEDYSNRQLEEQNTINEQDFLTYLDSGLPLKFLQAGIFPIIIVSNFFPFLSSISNNFITFNNTFGLFIYYLLVIVFNYFYTALIWDPEKISEKLRIASVSIENVTPGRETRKYLDRIVFYTSLVGGFSLALLLFFYDRIKILLDLFISNKSQSLFSEINISSLIIVVSIAYEFYRKIKSAYKSYNLFEYFRKKK
jgi:preprotein translocase subunit SecY